MDFHLHTKHIVCAISTQKDFIDKCRLGLSKNLGLVKIDGLSTRQATALRKRLIRLLDGGKPMFGQSTLNFSSSILDGSSSATVALGGSHVPSVAMGYLQARLSITTEKAEYLVYAGYYDEAMLLTGSDMDRLAETVYNVHRTSTISPAPPSSISEGNREQDDDYVVYINMLSVSHLSHYEVSLSHQGVKKLFQSGETITLKSISDNGYIQYLPETIMSWQEIRNVLRKGVEAEHQAVWARDGVKQVFNIDYQRTACISHRSEWTKDNQQLVNQLINTLIHGGLCDYVWFDWLSVPSDKTEEINVINNMGSIYGDCKAVYGLDDIALTDATQSGFNGVRGSSSWRTRLWTLQERHLACTLNVVQLYRMRTVTGTASIVVTLSSSREEQHLRHIPRNTMTYPQALALSLGSQHNDELPGRALQGFLQFGNNRFTGPVCSQLSTITSGVNHGHGTCWLGDGLSADSLNSTSYSCKCLMVSPYGVLGFRRSDVITNKIRSKNCTMLRLRWKCGDDDCSIVCLFPTGVYQGKCGIILTLFNGKSFWATEDTEKRQEIADAINAVSPIEELNFEAMKANYLTRSETGPENNDLGKSRATNIELDKIHFEIGG